MLPEELWSSIFGFLEWWKLAAYRRVSKEWQNHIGYTWNVMEKVQVDWFASHQHEKDKILLQYCRQLTSLNHYVARKALELATNNPNLRQFKTELSVYDGFNWYSSSLLSLRHSCPHLETLQARVALVPYQIEQKYDDKRSRSSLTRSFWTLWSDLKRVDLLCLERPLKDELDLKAIAQAKELTHVGLEIGPYIYNPQLQMHEAQSIVKHLPSLTSLALYACDSFSGNQPDEDLHISLRSKTLQSVRINIPTYYVKLSLVQLATDLPSLTGLSLFLHTEAAFDDTEMAAFLTMTSNRLRELEIFFIHSGSFCSKDMDSTLSLERLVLRYDVMEPEREEAEEEKKEWNTIVSKMHQWETVFERSPKLRDLSLTFECTRGRVPQMVKGQWRIPAHVTSVDIFNYFHS